MLYNKPFRQHREVHHTTALQVPVTSMSMLSKSGVFLFISHQMFTMCHGNGGSPSCPHTPAAAASASRLSGPVEHDDVVGMGARTVVSVVSHKLQGWPAKLGVDFERGRGI